jgi:anti-sigma regulatory factor (Ser/Thr protein kinase)
MTASSLSLVGKAAGGLAGNVASDMRCRWLAPAVEMAAVVSGNWPLWPEPGPGGWTCFPRVAIRSPGVHPTPARAARDFAAATVRRWGAAERTQDVAVVVSELVTNAMCHAVPDSGGPRLRNLVRLALVQPGPCVLCAVADPGRAAPVVKEADLLAETGRGLHVVGALADAWGYTQPSDRGKVVWAMFSTDRGRALSARPGSRHRRGTDAPLSCQVAG